MQTTMPPGQSFAKRWAIYAALGLPEIKLDAWSLSTKGLVEKELSFGFDELQKLPQIKLTRDFHCLSPGSLVFTNPLAKRIEDVRVGDDIIGIDGRRHRVEKLVRKRHDGRLLKIKASYLPPVRLTPDHKIWAVRGHQGVGKSKSQRRKRTFLKNPKPSWVRAEDLRIGDYVFFPIYREIDSNHSALAEDKSIRLDQSLAYILGWYVAEGSGGDSDGRIVRFALNQVQTSAARKLKVALERVFGAKVSIYKERNMNLVTVTSSRAKNLLQLLKKWCGDDAFSKRIPDFILNSELDILRVFLGALIDGDGYCPWRFHSRRSEASSTDFLDITTASETLAYQLVIALSKLNVPGDVVNHPGSVRNSFSVRVRGADQIHKILPRDKIPRRKGVDRRWYFQTPNGFYYPIKKIESEPYHGLVYDFTADGYTMLSPFVTLDCVTSWSIRDVVWEGVAFKELAKLTGVKPEAKWVVRMATMHPFHLQTRWLKIP